MVSPLDLIPGLSTLLDYFTEHRQWREDKKDEALLAIHAAALETKLYLESLQKKGRRARREERDLARLWQKAAIPVRHFDRDLADRCLSKADYWISPDTWRPEDIRDKRIGIDEVYQRARDLVLRR